MALKASKEVNDVTQRASKGRDELYFDPQISKCTGSLIGHDFGATPKQIATRPENERHIHSTEVYLRCDNGVKLPIVLQPPTPPPVHTQRARTGWAVLLTLLGLMVMLEAFLYFGRPDELSAFPTIEKGLTLNVYQRELPRLLPGSGAKSLTTAGQSSSLRRMIPKAEKGSSSLAMAELVLVLKTEAGESVTEEDLQRVRAAAAKPDKEPPKKGVKADARSAAAAIEGIYGSKTLTVNAANRYVAELPTTSIVYRLAAAHALEKAGVKDARTRMVSNAKVLSFAVAMVVVLIALFLGLGLWLVYIVSRINGKLKPLGHPVGDLDLLGADLLAGRAAQLMVGFAVLSTGGAYLTKLAGVEPRLGSVISSAVNLLLLPVVFLLPIAGRRVTLADIGWRKDNLVKNIGWGLSGAIANIPILLTLAAIGSFVFQGLPDPVHPVTQDLEMSQDIFSLSMLAFLASVAAPMFEETVFRGCIFPAIGRVLNSRVWGIVCSSLLFAAIHPTGVPAWLPLAGIGAMSCLLTLQTRSLVPSMVMHAVHNFATLALVLAWS